MSRKDVLLPYKFFDDSSLQSDLNSTPTSIQYLDNVAILLNFSGTGEGTFNIQGTLDYSSLRPDEAVWVSLELDQTMEVIGDADQILINLTQLSFPWIRVTYTSTFQSASIETVADTTGSLDGKYISITLIEDGEEAVYVFWFDVDDGGTPPVVPGATLIEVNISEDDTADAVATALAAELDISGISNIEVTTDTIAFNLDIPGGSIDEEDSGFTVSNVDATGTVTGWISAKMI